MEDLGGFVKIPKKLIPIGIAALMAAFFASATALAKPSPVAGGASKALSELPIYMVHSANLGNAEYMACIRTKIKEPAEVNLLSNYEFVLACQKAFVKS